MVVVVVVVVVGVVVAGALALALALAVAVVDAVAIVDAVVDADAVVVGVATVVAVRVGVGTVVVVAIGVAMNAVGYIRVSTDNQLDGLGLDIQEAAIRELSAVRGWELVDIFRDEGVSGSEDIIGRQGLANAIAALEADDVSVLVVPKLDRLARDLIVQESILRDVWRMGCEVVPCVEGEQFACRPDSPTDPSRKLIRQVLGAVAEYERAMIKARLVAGRRRKIAEVGYAGGPEPYGWSDPDEQRVIELVRVWRWEDEMTWSQIAAHLNGTDRRQRNGEPWTAQSLHRTINRAWERQEVGR